MDSALPKYYLIKKHIIEMINKEELEVGKLIPSERELILQFNVSRITVRKAIEDLVNEGYLFKIQGKGTYVKSDELKQDLFPIVGCAEGIKRMGMEPSKKLISCMVIPADKIRIRRLKLNDKDNVFVLSRVYYANNDPINYTTTYIPHKLFPGIENRDFSKESIYDVIKDKYGIKIISSTRTLEAVSSDNIVSDLLDMKVNSPILLFRATTYGNIDGVSTPIESFKCYYRSDRFKFYINQSI